MGNSKWVHLMFAVGGLLFAFLMVKMTEWILGYFFKPKDLLVLPIGKIRICHAGGSDTLGPGRDASDGVQCARRRRDRRFSSERRDETAGQGNC